MLASASCFMLLITGNTLRPDFGFSQSRQEHGCQNGDDRNHDQKFNQGETTFDRGGTTLNPARLTGTFIMLVFCFYGGSWKHARDRRAGNY